MSEMKKIYLAAAVLERWRV